MPKWTHVKQNGVRTPVDQYLKDHGLAEQPVSAPSKAAQPPSPPATPEAPLPA